MTNVKEDAPIRGAILFTANEIDEQFDFWRLTRDFDAVMEAPDDRVILGDSAAELKQLISDRYLCDAECTRIEDSSDDVDVIAEREPDTGYGRRRRQRYRSYGRYDHSVKGWKILPHVKVTEPTSRDQLQLLSGAHGYLLIEDCEFHRMGGETRFRADGFVTAQQCGHVRLKWNPANAIRQNQRQRVREIVFRLAPELPQEIVNKLGECVNPNNWPSEHPWKYTVYGPKGENAGWNHFKPYKYSTDEILTYVSLTRKLWPGNTPWRSGPFTGAIEEAVQHVHGLRTSTREHDQKLARWITREAKVAKVEIPRKPQLPKKPNKKRLRTCPRNSPQIKSTPPAPVSAVPCLT